MSVADFIGIPFAWGESTRSGADCTGLVRLYLRETHGLELPPDPEPGRHEPRAWLADSQARMAEYLNCNAYPTRRLQAGDVVLFHLARGAAHVGAMVSRTEFLHIMIGQTSRIDGLAGWRHRVLGFWRFGGE